MYEAGGWVLVESTLADLPADLRWLYESGAVTLEQLARLHGALGVTSIADLADAVRTETIRGVDGLGAPVEAAVARALPTLRAAIHRITLGRAIGVAAPLLASLRNVPSVAWAVATGSIRRGEDTVGDIELLAATSTPEPAMAQVLREPDIVRCLHRSDRRLYLLMDRVQVGIRFSDPANAGSELLYHTGSAAHLDALQAHAAKRRYQLTASGLVDETGQLKTAAEEEEIYRALGLPIIPPEIRSGHDEVDAAARGALPALVTRRDIRGDLHMHTNWSDGRDPIDGMVQMCRRLGYEYMAITDHSPSSAASRNLTVDGAKKQADEIAQLRERYPDIAILHGCEVDILADGRLDFPDKILARFDIVLASLHDRAGHSSDQLLRRYESAMRHPLVTLITHPTNRIVATRPAYDLDYDRLFELAVDTGTLLEVDGAPGHLDLDGAMARRAIRAGVTLTIDSDCHRADMLDRQMHLGVVMARRGWVEPRHVLNVRPLDEVRAVIGAKRNAH
jgi:DNA polymerase (family 10)